MFPWGWSWQPEKAATFFRLASALWQGWLAGGQKSHLRYQIENQAWIRGGREVPDRSSKESSHKRKKQT